MIYVPVTHTYNSVVFLTFQVILMSATFDSDMFAKYFSIPVAGHLEPAPIISIEGKAYPVQEFYIEELKTIGDVITLISLKTKNLLVPESSPV